MKIQLTSITIICIILLFCSSCSITRQTTCPTFTNKTEKIRKPLFAKKHSSKKDKKQSTKIAKQTKKKDTDNISFTRIESIISQIKKSDLSTLSDNDIVLNISNLPQNKNDLATISTNNIAQPKESKLQKFIYKKIEKKSTKILKKIEKVNQKRNEKADEDCKNTTSKKEHKLKLKKVFNNKNKSLISKQKTSNLSVLSFFSGILTYLIFTLSITYSWPIGVLVTIAASALAIILGIIAIVKIKKNPAKYKGKGYAIGGIILGSIFLFPFIYLAYLLRDFTISFGSIGG